MNRHNSNCALINQLDDLKIIHVSVHNYYIEGAKEVILLIVPQEA